MAEIVVVGAGGFGREVLDIIDELKPLRGEAWTVRGVVDDRPSEANLQRLTRRGVAFLGGVADVIQSTTPCHYVVGIGNPATREEVATKFDSAGFRPTTVIHPSVTQGFGVTIGSGSVLCAGVRLTTNICLGRHVHLNLNATVGHDTTIGDYVSVNPLASISGDCVLEDGVLVGVAGVVLNGVTVGRSSTVGGSACVVKDVAPHAVVKGVPAR